MALPSAAHNAARQASDLRIEDFCAALTLGRFLLNELSAVAVVDQAYAVSQAAVDEGVRLAAEFLAPLLILSLPSAEFLQGASREIFSPW